MSLPWSDEQRQWLQALGHQVWNLSVPDVATAPQPGAIEEAAALPRQEGPARPQPSRPPAAAQFMASRPAPTSDRLQQAIFRAAGRAAGDEAVAALLPDTSALRGNASAKRALWPRLRRLRRPEGA